MKTRLFILSLAMGASLAACDTPGDPSVARTNTGQVLGSAAREDIREADSVISVIDQKAAEITRRSRRQLHDRYQETLTIPGGSIFYEKLYQAGFNSSGTTAMEIITRDKFFTDNKINISFSDLKSATNTTGTLKYVAQDSGGHRCFLFQQYFGRFEQIAGGGLGQGEYIRGAKCLPVGNPQSAAIEPEMLDLLGRFRFDGGQLNKARAQQQPAAAPVATRPSGNAGSIPVNLTWEGERATATGVMRFTGQNGGTVSVNLQDKPAACSGTWAAGPADSAGAVAGTWSLSCIDGRTATGTFRSPRYGQGTGEGKDSTGKGVTFDFGRTS
jgi:hypothetical protein